MSGTLNDLFLNSRPALFRCASLSRYDAWSYASGEAMRRPDKAGGKAAKTQRPRTLKRRNAAKVGREAPAIGATERIALLEHRLNEALEQQTATSDVLDVISRSPGELKPVFEAILESATRICTAKFANLFLYADNSFRIAAQKNAPLAYAKRWRQRPVLAVGDNPHNPLDRLASTKSVINIPDLMAERGYIERNPRFVALVEAAGARTHVAVPMLKEGELIGAISIFRQEVRPFTDKQIELVKNFAAQAVIAIENTRLLNELRQRTRSDDRWSSRRRHPRCCKSSAVRRANLQPVFDAMLENATRICEAKFGNMFLFDGQRFQAVARPQCDHRYARPRIASAGQFVRAQGPGSVAWPKHGKWFTSPT